MMDSTEREIFTEAVSRAVATHTGQALDAALDEIGWTDALGVDPQVALAALFEAQGARCATSSALAVLLGVIAGVEPVIDGGLAGNSTTPVVLPSIKSASAPAIAAAEGVDEAVISFKGLTIATSPDVEHVVVVGDGSLPAEIEPPGAHWCATLARDALTARSVGGLDPALALCEVSATDAELDVFNAIDGSWTDAVSTGRLAVAHEMLGAMRTMLELAREHALERVQFDRPIAGFQAVRHRLAETYVAIEATESALAGAWLDRNELTAKIAKVVAGNSALLVRKHCQQVLAGIGFTAEHELHRYLRRTMVLDALLGDTRSLQIEIGEHLLALGRPPNLLPL